MRAEGIVTVSGITLADGSRLSTQQAVERGWITPIQAPLRGWNLERHEVPISHNLFVDQGRQIVAYAFGFRSPASDYTVQKFGVGTGTTPAKVTDVALESPVTLSGGDTVKAIDSVDFISPFVVRVAFTLGLADANGYLLTEMGLFSGGNALLARKVRTVGINKTGDFSPTLHWRVRF